MIARTEGSFPPSQSNLRHSSPKMLNANSLSCRRQSSRNRSLQTSKGNCNSFMTYGRATLTPDSCGPKRQLTPNCRGMNYKILKPTCRILNVGDPFSGVSVTAIFSTARSGCQPATIGVQAHCYPDRVRRCFPFVAANHAKTSGHWVDQLRSCLAIPLKLFPTEL